MIETYLRCFLVYSSFRYTPRSEIARSHSNFMFNFFEEMSYHFLQWLHHFTFLSAMYKGSDFSISLSTLKSHLALLCLSFPFLPSLSSSSCPSLSHSLSFPPLSSPPSFFPFFHNDHSHGCEVVAHCSFDCTSLMISDISIFPFAYCYLFIFFGEMSNQVLCQFFKQA